MEQEWQLIFNASGGEMVDSFLPSDMPIPRIGEHVIFGFSQENKTEYIIDKVLYDWSYEEMPAIIFTCHKVQ